MDESSRKRRREKSRLRRCRNLADKESDIDIKINNKQKKKSKKKKLQNKQTKANLELQKANESSAIQIYQPLPHYFQVHDVEFKDSYFDDHAFMYKPDAPNFPEVVGSVTHIADETTTLDSPDCRRYTMFAVDDFNVSNQKNLELVNILNVNRMVCSGYLAFTRFVAKDLDTGKTAIYRAAVHEFGFYTRLVHFKAEGKLLGPHVNHCHGFSVAFNHGKN